MFSQFIKNKILSALVLISSFAYGGQANEAHSHESAQHPNQQEQSKTISSTESKIYVNGIPFYIPPEEPSREEIKKKAVLMYWERLDKKTGKIIVTKYPDTLNVKEDEADETYTDSDLTLSGTPSPQKAVATPKVYSAEQITQPSPAQKQIDQKPVSEADSLEEILNRLEAEERSAQQAQQPDTIKTNAQIVSEASLKDFSKENSPSNTVSADTGVFSCTNEPTNAVCETSAREIKELLALIEQDSKKEETQSSNTNQVVSVSEPSSNAVVSTITDIPSKTDLPIKTNAVCDASIREVKELLALIEPDSKKEEMQPSNTNQIVSVSTTNSNAVVSTDTDIPSTTDLPIKTNAVCDTSTREIETAMALLNQMPSSSDTNVVVQSTKEDKTEMPLLSQQSPATNTVQDLDNLTDTPQISVSKKSKNPLDDLNELLQETEPEKSSDIPDSSPFTTGGIILSALGGSVLLGMAGIHHRKKKSDSDKENLPKNPTPAKENSDKEKLPAKTVPTEENSDKERAPSNSVPAEKILDKESLPFNLIPAEEISKQCVEKRNELANKLKAVRTLEDIKRYRSLLSKQIRAARKVNDEETIQSILNTRKELTQKRRQACLCITDPYTSRIKEERRLLTKQMTLARRKKDAETMAQITHRREELKKQVKSLNAYVRGFNYTQKRSSFLKEATLKSILSHQNQKS